MILIADSGSTKTDWILTDKDKNQSRYNTIGYNPYFIDSSSIYDSLTLQLVSQFDAATVEKIFFTEQDALLPKNRSSFIMH